MLVLGIKPRSSGRAASGLNHRAISPTLMHFFLVMGQLFFSYLLPPMISQISLPGPSLPYLQPVSLLHVITCKTMCWWADERVECNLGGPSNPLVPNIRSVGHCGLTILLLDRILKPKPVQMWLTLRSWAATMRSLLQAAQSLASCANGSVDPRSGNSDRACETCGPGLSLS